MPSPEFERDKAMFELNVVQVALALANDKLSELNKDIEKYHTYVIDVLPKWVAQENEKLKNAKERRIKEEARMERAIKYHEMVRILKEQGARIEKQREEIRLEKLEISKIRNQREEIIVKELENLLHNKCKVEDELRALTQERDATLLRVQDLNGIEDIPKLIKEVVRLKTSIARLNQSRDAALRDIKALGLNVSEDRCLTCGQTKTLTRKMICEDCVGEGLLELHERGVSWALDVLKPPDR